MGKSAKSEPPSNLKPSRSSSYSEELKARVMAALMTGEAILSIARTFEIPESTIRSWRDSLPAEQLANLRAKKSEQIEELMFDYLSSSLKALSAQAQVMSETTYLKKQSGNELAVLYGVVSDKAIRVLEAIERTAEALTSK